MPCYTDSSTQRKDLQADDCKTVSPVFRERERAEREREKAQYKIQFRQAPWPARQYSFLLDVTAIASQPSKLISTLMEYDEGPANQS